MYQMYVLCHRSISINKRKAEAEEFWINDHTEHTGLPLTPFATMENLQLSELLCSGHGSHMT